MYNRRVLIISEVLEAGEIWGTILKKKGAQSTLLSPNESLTNSWLDQSVDVIVIDIYDTESDRINLIKSLRAEVIVPILLLMPENHETYILEAYEAGIDEYIFKPISPLVFLAKLNVWTLRSQSVPTSILDSYQVGDLHLEPAQRQLSKADGSNIRLTNLEFRLLHILMNHPNQVIESNILIDRVWGNISVAGDVTLVKNVVYRLRRKIEPNPAQPRYIQSIAGEGYMFVP